ncbi:hypothetical protein GJ496_003294 [Pomphorhynchus laevis]|nr:hypothetical protein GJ496_003294 [Pomphorhynchus laevis]
MFSSKFTFPNTGFSLSNTTPTTTSAISTGGGLFGSSIFAAPTSSTATTSSFSNLAFSNLSSSSTFGTTSSPFKSSSTTSPFTIGQQISGTTIKFDPVVSIDNVKKGAVNQKQNIKFMSISAMTQYQTKSFEELRLEDYAANRKTSNLASSFFKPALGTTNAFGTATTSSSASSWFNKSFGGISSSPAITSTSAFGLVSKPLFTPGTFGGLATNPTTTTSSGFIFGTGTTTTAPSGIFGKPIASTSTSIFGTPTTNTTTSKFGNMFGTSLTPASTSAPSLFPSFGSGLATSNSLATTTASGGLFGTKPFGSTPTFGTSGSLFGSSTATSQPANATMPVATTQSSFLFGGTNKPLTSLFGSQTSTSGTSSFFGGQSIQQASQVPIASSGVSAQPLSSLLYFASKDKDPEVAKRSAQMLLRAQCYSYSNDPIFNDYVPNSTTDKSSLIGQLSMTVGKAEASTPEPLAHRVRFLLPKPINSSSLYPVSGASRETGKTSFSEQRHNRSIELKRLILPQRSAKNSQLSSTKSKEEINASDLTLEDFLSNSSPSQHSFGLYPRIETVETTPSAKEDTKPLFDCCVKLTRPGYKTCPPIYKLILDPETNSCIISDFAIYREGYGSITWPGITDVANFDLDSIVFIRRKEVIVYPDDDNKPPENEGLNKPAEITLHSVFPLDKFTGQAIKDAHQLDEMNYTQFLEDATTRMGAHFVDYLSATGSWTFKVDHFTRYGLNPQDSHVDPEYKFATNSMYCWQNKNEKDLKCPGNFSPDAYSTVLHCLNGDQKENVDTMPIKELTRRISSMTSDLSKQEDDDVLEYISNQSELLNKSQTTLNEYQFVPIQIPWSSSLLNTDRNLTWDRAFFVSKSFRFNLHGSKRIYYCPSDNTDESLSVLRPSKFSTDCSRTDESSLFPRIAIMQTNEFIGKMKTNISALKEDIITFNILNDSLSLLNILFVDDVDEISRKSNLICWLKSSINPSIVHEKCIYSQILHHLCNLDRKYAVQKAMSSNNFRLAQLISVPPGMANVQNALKNQLIHWCDREADQFIEKILLKIYLLLSGELFIELSDSTSVSLIVDKSWRENLLIILGYCCLADATCANAIVLLDNLVKSNLCVAEEDLSWNILKFYVDPATSDICDILQISKFIQTDDYSLSWYMLQAVDSLAIKRISSSIYDKVCIEFARQLEGVGMWDWACFVLSHINDPKIRSFMCEDILNRNVCADHDLCSIETWLTHELHWNPAIIHKAKSIKAQYQKNWFLCCDHKIQANDPHAALVMIFEKILPESFEKDDRAELVQLLELIAIYVQLNGPVEGWMNSGYSLHLYFSTQSKFANNDTLNSDTGLLEFAETVTRNFDIITSKLNDFVKEGKIGLSILSSICEGICSSMYLLCKWISQGSLLKYHYDRALEIIIAKETIISRVNSVEFCEEVNF